MAQVFRTVANNFPVTEFFRQTGQTVLVGDEVFVRADFGSLLEVMAGSWFYSREEADEDAAKTLEERRRRIDLLIAELRRPLPAAAAADSSAAGRAQAAVAT
jgi:hypothetical protein